MLCARGCCRHRRRPDILGFSCDDLAGAVELQPGLESGFHDRLAGHLYALRGGHICDDDLCLGSLASLAGARRGRNPVAPHFYLLPDAADFPVLQSWSS